MGEIVRSWADFPIKAGDLFVPLGSCRVRSATNTWVIVPSSCGGGDWTRIPNPSDDVGTAYSPIPRDYWHIYDWIIWHEDGPNYRLRLGTNRTDSSTLTGHLISVEGEFANQSPGSSLGGSAR